MDFFKRFLKRCLEQDAKNGISQLLMQWKERLVGYEFQQGCPIVAAAIESEDAAEAEANNEIRLAVSEVFKSWQNLLALYLQKQGNSEARSNQIAICIIASIEGAVLLCRGHQSIDAFDAVIACVPSLIKQQ